MSDIRVGFGFDIHRLRKGSGIMLGGLKVECGYGVVSHSDGDVILHAVSDAVLGAIGEGDTGRFFPPGKSTIKGIASRRILDYAVKLAGKKGFKLVNIDVTVVFEALTLKYFRNKISKSIAQLCDLKIDAVNVKAKTMEGLSDIGKKEAIACYSAILLSKRK